MCNEQRYKIVPDFPLDTSQKCEKCPLGAQCRFDGSCALPEFICAPPDTTVVVGKWLREETNRERGRYMLESCPAGFSKRGSSKVMLDLMECKECNRVLHYIIEPNAQNCQRCPPGLVCNGNNITSLVVAGSDWSVQTLIMRLHACPTGYKVWPALAPGEMFDDQTHAPSQECAVCTEGMECILERCLNCTQCPAGKYKDTPGTASCRKCAAGKFNTKIKSMSESFCSLCPEGSDTRGIEGAISIQDCECVVNMYMTIDRTGDLGMRCFQCPAAAMCPDGSCGLSNFPAFECIGIGSENSMPNVVGTWIRDESQKYGLLDCPIGHQLINNTGYELQECSLCTEGKYISSSSDPQYSCFNCPPSARCPNKGNPIFPEAEVKGNLDLSGELPSEEDLILIIARSMDVDPKLVAIADYGTLAESLMGARRRSVQKRKSSKIGAYQVKFSVWTTTRKEAEELHAAGGSAFANISHLLSQISPDTVLIGAGSDGLEARLPGEDWQQVGFAFMLITCPMGHLLVNASIDSQKCLECEADTYIVDMFQGCADGMCSSRPCSTCPVGVVCGRGLNPPWRHFVPKLLKIGTRTIEYALIQGLTLEHEINHTMYYELFYNNYSGDASVIKSHGQNPLNYVWEYVVECSEATQPCDKSHVHTYYLRVCPRGTQLVNSTIGSYNFNVDSQQCVPCGPLNYIVHPTSRGTCQECPKGNIHLFMIHSVPVYLHVFLHFLTKRRHLAVQQVLFVQMGTYSSQFREAVSGKSFIRDRVVWMPFVESSHAHQDTT